MVVFEGTSKKKDGTKRKMKFVRLHDMPKMAGKPTSQVPEGSELVWDVEKNGYRVFNWRSVVGRVTATAL